MTKWWKRAAVGLVATGTVFSGALTQAGSAQADEIGQFTTTTGAVIKFTTDNSRKVTVNATGLRPTVQGGNGWCWFRVVANDNSSSATNGTVLIKSDGTFTDTVGPLASNGQYKAILECTAQNAAQDAEMTADPLHPVAAFAMTNPFAVPITISGSSTGNPGGNGGNGSLNFDVQCLVNRSAC